MNNINCVTEEKKNCFGCRACANICPVKAITMQEDEEGFFYPVIDETKCTNCGLCKKACPALNKSEVYKNNTTNPDCYALMADDDIRAVSSSGGAFTLIADWILDQGGYVCGVAYVGQKVQHIIINKKEDLARLRGSKYVQSNTNMVYSEIKKLLNDNKLVLFTGTPCQVVGLNTFLGKTYDNLYTIDLLCHGVPPQKVFDMYLKETIGDEKFINGSFRDKSIGWSCYATKIQTDKKIYYTPIAQDSYLQAFVKNISLRPSCGICPFTTKNRVSDFTIGDYWAVGRYDKKLNDEKGTSVIIVHSSKAEQLFDIIKNNAKTCVKTPIEYASWYNITLYTPLKQHPNRQAFFRLINQGKTLKETVEYCNKNKFDCGILNFWASNNYGGLLTCYALQETIKNLGYTTCIIKLYNPSSSYVSYFADKYLNITENLYNQQNIAELNKYTDNFIVGSDCVFAPQFFIKHFLLGFANLDKKKISYAPSFGQKFFSGSFNLKNNFKYYLQQFDALSVRELSGVDLCKNEFDLNVTQVMDPVFLKNQDFYNNLIEESDLNSSADMSYYIFKADDDTDRHLSELKQKIGDNIININMKETEISVSKWLANIKKSKFIYTQSFHGTCFAIIYNIPFVFIPRLGFDNARVESILKIFGLENRIIKHEETIKNRSDLFEPIDWDRVNSIIEQEKEHSIKWLKDALEAPKDLSKINPADAIIQSLNSKILALEYSNRQKVCVEDMISAINYNKLYRKYLKYKILKNVVFGKTKERYKRKQKELHEKIKKARRMFKKFR